jgi:hypothetical protein
LRFGDSCQDTSHQSNGCKEQYRRDDYSESPPSSVRRSLYKRLGHVAASPLDRVRGKLRTELQIRSGRNRGRSRRSCCSGPKSRTDISDK